MSTLIYGAEKQGLRKGERRKLTYMEKYLQTRSMVTWMNRERYDATRCSVGGLKEMRDRVYLKVLKDFERRDEKQVTRPRGG